MKFRNAIFVITGLCLLLVLVSGCRRETAEDVTNEYLKKIDQDLRLVENGKLPKGSFTDCFVPNVCDAYNSGVTKQQVETRVDRLIELLRERRFYSSCANELFSNGGEQVIRNYIDKSIGDK